MLVSLMLGKSPLRGVLASVSAISRIASATPHVSPFRAFSRSAAASTANTPDPSEMFLNGTTTAYAESLFEQWRQDPNSVHPSWRTHFELQERGYGKGQTYSSPPGMNKATPIASAPGTLSEDEARDTIKVERLIRAYEVRGHNEAKLDPLGILSADLDERRPPELTLDYYGFTEADKERTFALVERAVLDNATSMKLGDIIERLEDAFCSNVGYEYMHIQDRDLTFWLNDTIAEVNRPFSDDKRKKIFKHLIQAHGFEEFLKAKFVSEKRFGIEGCESLIPGMKSIIETGASDGVEYVVLGMPHRGRLNVLYNVLQKPGELIFNEFHSRLSPHDEGSGDVKYHLGMSSDIDVDGKKVHLTLMANPSHLEAVNPVVLGKARAEQFYRGDVERKKVLPILLHGDAAFAGQGVVYEGFGLANLPAYTTGGTIHIVVNNQIGFTTDPRKSRSTQYCTDLAKMVGAPIFHVNGDDPEAVVRCCETAIKWRQHTGTDVVVDIVCYRKHGHNEADNPKFTQPLMYQMIDKHPPTREIYAKRLTEEGVVDQAFIDETRSAYHAKILKEYEDAPSYTTPKFDTYRDRWADYYATQFTEHTAKVFDTGVDEATLKHIGQVYSSFPEDFNIHRNLKKILNARMKTIDAGEGLDWATAEAMAFGSLLMEKKNVRLSGQDVERGTFSHRHHVLHDQKVDEVSYQPLHHLSDEQGTYMVSNSHLSEYAVLGFELGYSLAGPDSLVCWEAQFGDFHNTAQPIIDQFIVSMEQKWQRQTGLVMLLPHGFEGMGPEHSSARIERFLQMTNENEEKYPDGMEHSARTQIQNANIQVLNCTTPANYFHALRRQIYREFRKPCIIMTPKSLLRHPLAKSSLSEMTEGTRFRRFIPDHTPEVLANPENVKRLVLCSGKVYYDLVERREKEGITDIAIGRLEQISPFPFDLVHRHADDFPNAEIVWCQEEPRNYGPWSYVDPRIRTALRKSTHHQGETVKYTGRDVYASVATGDKSVHNKEVESLLRDALDLN